MMRNAILTLAAGGIAALVTIPANAAEPKAILESYADVALAAYEDSLETAKALDAAIDALVAKPSAEMLDAAPVSLILKPNAGLPDIENGRAVYRQTAVDFAADVGAMARQGAGAVGGCCGTDDHFIAALRAELDAGPQR